VDYDPGYGSVAELRGVHGTSGDHTPYSLLVWHDGAFLTTSALAGLAVLVSAWSLRSQLLISREQRLWDERKSLYVDLLREQSMRWQSAAEPHEVRRSWLVPDDVTPEGRLAAFDMPEARLNAIGSRAVIHAVFDAEAEATHLSMVVLRAREAAGVEEAFEGERESPEFNEAFKRHERAESRLTERIRDDLSYQPYRWWHRLQVRAKQRRRPTTPQL